MRWQALSDRPAGECTCRQYQEGDKSDDQRILHDRSSAAERSRYLL